MTTIRLQRIIALVSVVLFIAKLWAWYLTKSVTILTDAMESIVNVVAGFIGLYAVTIAARPRDANHPYGHGKIEFISSGIEGGLIVAAALMVGYQAVEHFIHPVKVEKLDLGIVITAVTGVANFFLGQWAVSTGIKKRSATLEAAGRHLRTDAYSTVAIIAGLLLVLVTRWIWLDAAVAAVFAAIIFMTGAKVLRKSLAGIMDEADATLLQNVVSMLQEHRPPQWIDLHNLRVIQYGEVLHIDAHMTLPYYFEVRQADDEIQALEALSREHFSEMVELFIHIDGCAFYQCKLCAMPDCPVRQEPLKQQLTWTVENVMYDSKHGKVIS